MFRSDSTIHDELTVRSVTLNVFYYPEYGRGKMYCSKVLLASMHTYWMKPWNSNQSADYKVYTNA